MFGSHQVVDTGTGGRSCRSLVLLGLSIPQMPLEFGGLSTTDTLQCHGELSISNSGTSGFSLLPKTPPCTNGVCATSTPFSRIRS